MIKKCLFPAAGFGTRFLPATKTTPKEMMAIVNKPLIHYGVEEALDASLREMAIVTGRNKRAIEDYFDVSYELEDQLKNSSKEYLLNGVRNLMNECTFSYTRQTFAKGLGHAILTGKPLINNEPFAVVLADDLCVNIGGDSVLKQMVKLYKQFRCSIVAVQEVDMDCINRYGVISGAYMKDNIIQVDDMVEKPSKENAPSNLAIIGRYILTPDIFDILENTQPGSGGEIQITDALLEQAKSGCVLAYKFQGKRFDCGSVDGFIEATEFFYQNNLYQK